jgi:hypothetical protein
MKAGHDWIPKNSIYREAWMDDVLRAEPAEAVSEELNATKVALIKGMILRGDRQNDIAAYFKFNPRVISHINTGHYKDYVHVRAADPHHLPPADYPSPYELIEAQRSLWRVRVALETVEEELRHSLAIMRKAESHGPVNKMGQRS